MSIRIVLSLLPLLTLLAEQMLVLLFKFQQKLASSAPDDLQSCHKTAAHLLLLMTGTVLHPIQQHNQKFCFHAYRKPSMEYEAKHSTLMGPTWSAALGSPVQQGHRPAAASPPAGHEDDQRDRAPLLWGKGGRIEIVQPGKEKTFNLIEACQYLKGLREKFGVRLFTRA